MPNTDGWIWQGRQDHGHFGTGTKDADADAPLPESRDERLALMATRAADNLSPALRGQYQRYLVDQRGIWLIQIAANSWAHGDLAQLQSKLPGLLVTSSGESAKGRLEAIDNLIRSIVGVRQLDVVANCFSSVIDDLGIRRFRAAVGSAAAENRPVPASASRATDPVVRKIVGELVGSASNSGGLADPNRSTNTLLQFAQAGGQNDKGAMTPGGKRLLSRLQSEADGHGERADKADAEATAVATKRFTPTETHALRQLFGVNEKGVGDLLEKLAKGPIALPPELTPELFETYAKIAEDAIARGIDKRGVQALRLQAIRQILNRR